MSEWLVLGSSLCAPRYKDIDCDHVVTAGAGISLRPDSHYHIIGERSSLQTCRDEQVAARESGMKIVTTYELAFPNGRTRVRLRALGAVGKWWDISLPMLPPYAGRIWEVWEKGYYGLTPAGGLGVQFAINNGASRVHMVGMEGYSLTEVDYFTGEKSRPVEQPGYYRLMQRIVSQCPEVEFVKYGEFNYELEGDNVTQHVNDPPPTTEEEPDEVDTLLMEAD